YEQQLLNAVVDTLIKTPFVQRIESQLMMLRHGASIALPQWRYLRIHGRIFMEIDLDRVARLPEHRMSQSVLIDSWAERTQEEAAALIASAYQGHVDSQINDQYRSPAGARRFLLNIIQYPGCGSFFQPASYLAVDSKLGRLSGICLASLVQSDVGH